MSSSDGPRQLFTQASNPNAPTPMGSPYGSPPPGAYSPGSGAPLAQGGGTYTPTAYAPNAYASPPAPAHQGSLSSPPVGAPGYAQPQFGQQQHLEQQQQLAQQQQFAQQQQLAQQQQQQQQQPYVPTNYANEKATYQPQPSPAYPPQSTSPPAGADNPGPMAYHQVTQGAPPPPPQQQPAPVHSPGAAPVMQQPAPTQPMGITPGAGRYDAKGERDWTHGLFDCFSDVGTCVIACFVPCVTYGQNKSRLEHLDRHQGAPHPTGGEMVSGDCMVHGLLTFCGCGWVLQIGSRGNVRNRYRIRGGGCGDCCAAFCCTPCELTQESLELAQEERAYKQGTAMSDFKA